ncbi:MAG: hypothetical protein KAW92_07180 [Candidatus Cloacimonetes bacterium]|nr:hypothetical protein [Candidatus Cloacimonadota bacterium]
MKKLPFITLILTIYLFSCATPGKKVYFQHIGNISFGKINSLDDTYEDKNYFYMKSPMIVNKLEPNIAVKFAYEENMEYFSQHIATKISTLWGSNLTVEQKSFAKKLAGSLSRTQISGVDRYKSWIGVRKTPTGANVYECIIIVRVDKNTLKRATNLLNENSLQDLKNKSEKEIDEYLKKNLGG